jgi:NAD(P)-dependent dehydrogenase (short-subunit alcohol dehydrogenase family)
VLVAGGWKGGKPLHEDRDGAIWRAMLDSNLETARIALQALVPGMVQRKGGSIVLIGSRSAARPWESKNAAAYAASKAAVVGMAKAVAAELIADGVRINVVHPSTIDTPANRASNPEADPADWVTPESLSAVIGFLLSDAARDISGAELPVYGRVGA